MKVSRDCWKCEYEDCGHVWLASGDEPPEQCARCKRRKWHTDGLMEENYKPQPVKVVKEIKPRKAKPIVKPDPSPIEEKKQVALAAAPVMPAAQLSAPSHAPGCKCGVCRIKRGEM